MIINHTFSVADKQIHCGTDFHRYFETKKNTELLLKIFLQAYFTELWLPTQHFSQMYLKWIMNASYMCHICIIHASYNILRLNENHSNGQM